MSRCYLALCILHWNATGHKSERCHLMRIVVMLCNKKLSKCLYYIHMLLLLSARLLIISFSVLQWMYSFSSLSFHFSLIIWPVSLHFHFAIPNKRCVAQQFFVFSLFYILFLLSKRQFGNCFRFIFLCRMTGQKKRD